MLIPISLKKSAHSFLTSGIKKAFLKNSLVRLFFVVFGPITVNHGDACVRKSQLISIFRNPQTSPSGTNNYAMSKVTLLSVLMVGLNFNR